MGVDFYAYSYITHLPNLILNDDSDDIEDQYDKLYDNNIYQLFAYVGFHRSTRGLVNHKVEKDGFLCNEWYSVGPVRHEWGTSYGWYSMWRKTLSKAILGVSTKKVWADHKKYKKKPFFEIINFADNEGTIGPAACADLLLDFKEHRDTYVSYIQKKFESDYDRNSYIEFYDDFTTGLEAAALEGCIRLS